MQVLKTWRKAKQYNLLDGIFELISNIDVAEIWKYIGKGSAAMTL